MKTYYANFNANNGTSLDKSITDTNKQRLIKDIMEIAEGECYCNNSASWYVLDEDGNEIASGEIYKNHDGKTRRYRTK